MKRRYTIFTIAALEDYARDCRLPMLERGSIEVENGGAREALEQFVTEGTVYIPQADYFDTAVGYEACEKDRPLVWLATLDS